jgi:hypothetical protein
MKMAKGEDRPCSACIRVRGLSYGGGGGSGYVDGFLEDSGTVGLCIGYDLMFSRNRFCILSLWNTRLPLIAGFPVSCVVSHVFRWIYGSLFGLFVPCHLSKGML